MEGDQPYAPKNPQPPPRPEQASPPVVSEPEPQPLPQAPPSSPNQRPKKHYAKTIIIAVTLALILGSSGYFIFWRDKNKSTLPAASSESSPAGTTTQVASDITLQTKTFSSTKQGLSFAYPQDWVVVEETGLIKVTSPPLKLTDASSKSVTGQILLQVRAKAANLPEFDGGSATAVLDSQKAKYAKPTKVQRGETYVSFLQYAGTSPAGLDGIYVTGNLGYKTGQTITKADFAPADPKITITFNQCADSSCLQNPTKLTLAKDTWANASFSESLVNIIKSFSIN